MLMVVPRVVVAPVRQWQADHRGAPGDGRLTGPASHQPQHVMSGCIEQTLTNVRLLA
jgi:hypothetical protein